MKLGRICFTVAAAVSMVACGDNTPEADAARKLGAAPKQIVDRATTDIGKALEQGADRSRDAEQGKN